MLKHIPFKRLAKQYDLKGNELLILIALIDIAQCLGLSFYISLQTISKKCGLRSILKIKEYLKYLEQKNIIQFSKFKNQNFILKISFNSFISNQSFNDIQKE